MVIRRNLQFAGKSNSFNSFSIYPTPPANTCQEGLDGSIRSLPAFGCQSRPSDGGVGVHGPDDGQTGSVIRLLISALLEKEWQRHLQAINPRIIFSKLRKHQSLPPPPQSPTADVSLTTRVLTNRNQDTQDRTTLTCPLVSRVSEGLLDLLRGSSAPSPSTRHRLGQINGTAGRRAFKWAFLMGVVVEKGGVNEARSCFHPDLSASALQVSILWL